MLIKRILLPRKAIEVLSVAAARYCVIVPEETP
jgi:hypothetical protein